MNIENFDIVSYLEEKGILNRPFGKNVGRDWIGICCPFCDESGFHMGINMEHKGISCFVCGEKGTIIKLLTKIEGSYSKALDIINNSSPIYNYLKEEKKGILKPPKNIFKLLDIKESEIYKKALEYFRERGFPEPESLFKDYNMFIDDPFLCGYYKGRAIVPIKLNGETVTYLGIDILGISNVKYLPHPKEKSLISIKSCLLGIDKINEGDEIVIVEGFIDQAKLGFGSVAAFGKIITDNQIKLLKVKKVSKVHLLLDSDASDKAKKTAGKIYWCPVVSHTLNGYKDPGEMSVLEARKLMWDIRKK